MAFRRTTPLITLAFLFCAAQTMLAQNCGERYKQRYFSSIQVFRGVEYTYDAPNLLSAGLGIETTFPDDLEMDIFMPPPTDTVTNRPVIIFAHGGGFVNVLFMGGTVLVGTKDNEDVQALADTFAHWGYVTASIQYRTGFDVLSSTSLNRAVWRGSQDISAGIRFFRHNAQWFGIDPNRVFIGGSSAGAFACLHSTFIDGNERIPESYEQTPIVMADLGEMHSRPVAELTSFNPFAGVSVFTPTVDSLPQGIASYWGAIGHISMLSGNNSAPTIMFHGDADIVVDAECAPPFSGLILAAPETCGSIVMDSAMTANGTPHETHIEPGQSHEYWGVLNGDWLPTGPNAFWHPMIQQTANFFYDIMRPATPQISGPFAVAPNTPYTFSIVSPQPNTVYCWEIDNGVIVSPNTTASSIQVEFYNNGIIGGSVKVKAIDRAQVASLQRIHNLNISPSVNVQQLVNEAVITLMPNPASSEVRIQSTEALEFVAFFDVQGKEVERYNNLTSNTLAIGHLPEGVYFVRMGNSKGVYPTQKLLIQR